MRRHTVFLALIVALGISPACAAITAQVSVDAATLQATMPATGLGLHTAPYYNNMSHPDVNNRLEEAGVTTLRYGGGGADVFHWSIARAAWENGIIGGGLTPWFGQATDFGYVGAGSDFASFVRLLDQMENGRAVITVNYGSAMKLVSGQSAVPQFGGQPKEAAAWVAYANVDPAIYGTPSDIVIGVDEQGNDWKTAGYWARLRASTAAEYAAWATADDVYDPLNQFLAIDRDPPVAIKYWEIGNETFGTNYYGTNAAESGYSVDYDLAYGTDRRGHPELSPAQYGQDVVQYSQLMKAIDPTTKIGAVLSTPPDDWNWDYFPKAGGPNHPNNRHWNHEVLDQAAEHIDFGMVHWYPQAGSNANGDSLLAQVAAKLPPMIDGATPGQDVGQDAGVRDLLAAHGIPQAEIMVTEFNYFGSLQGSLANAAESIFVAGAYATWLERGVTSVNYLEMLTKDFLSDSSSLVRGSAFYGVTMVDKLAKPGDVFLESTSSHANVRAHAALREDGNLAIMILNHHRTESAEVTINVDGLLLGSEGTRFTLVNGTNLSQTIAAELGNFFTASVAPRSIATFLVPVMLPGDYSADGEVNAADYVLWRELNNQSGSGLAADGNGDGVVDELDYEQWRRHFGKVWTGVAAGSGAATALPEPASWSLVVTALIGVPPWLPRTAIAKPISTVPVSVQAV